DRSNARGTRLVATNGSASLAALRVDQSYERRSAGEVVTDLAGQAGASTGAIEDGIDLPAFVADGSRSAWSLVAALAARCGFLAVVNGDGDLTFGPIDPGSPVRAFTAGRDVPGGGRSASVRPRTRVRHHPGSRAAGRGWWRGRGGRRPAGRGRLGGGRAAVSAVALYETVRAIVRDQLATVRTAELGVVQDQHPHASEGDTDNYACTVTLRDSGIVLKKVPVATNRIGAASIPNVGDLVLVQFVGGDIHAPVITGR